MTITGTTPPSPDTGLVPTFPFSMFDPVHLGVDENGEHVYVNLAERNMLLGGEPGGGKSSGLNLITAHGALSHDCKLILVDGNQVQLGPWRHCADTFIGPSIKDAIEAFKDFQATMNDRYNDLLATGRRKITRDSGEHIYLIVIDEYAYYSATIGSKQEREAFGLLARDLIARGRAAGVILILATQRPSHQVIDPSMRDLFGYRWAFRCTTDSSSDVVLGAGWAAEGYTAADIDPLARGVGWLLSETGVPRRIKAAYLEDHHIKYLAAYAAAPARQGRRMSHLHAVNDCNPPSLQGRSAGPDTVKTPLTPKRPGRVRENDEYAAFARRVLRAYARRIATGDVEALTLMTGLAEEIDTAISQAVAGLRGFGYSWAEIGSRLGVTRQAAQQRWGRTS